MPTAHNRQGVNVTGKFMTSDPGHQNNKEEHIIPLYYHAHHQGFDDDLSFWLELAHGQGGPILELGCGTGRVLIPLAEDGYKCYGLDQNPKMLEFIHQQTSSKIGKKINTIQADLTAFKIGIKFPLIILPCNTFSTLGGTSRLSALGCINMHLSEGGLFATSVPNPEILSMEDSSDQSEIEMIFPHPISKNPVQVSYTIVRKLNLVTIHWYYDHLLPDGVVDRLIISTRHNLLSTSQYLNEFQKSGYAIENTYGDFNFSSLTKDSTNLIIVARKI
jgi:SAM-dependent methyltransferase